MGGIDNLAADVQGITEGRPYVFVIRAFGEKWDIFSKHVKPVVERETGLLCLDAEDIPGAGHDLLAKVHLLIDRAEAVIAEISNKSPNVFYETGYASALGKPLLLLVEEGYEVPANLRGRVLIRYAETRPGLHSLDEQLADAIRSQVTSSVALLKDMLLAENPFPAYIVSSPKYPGPDSRMAGEVCNERTFGDNLGIRGLLSAFGVMFGRGENVELISAQHSPPNLVQRPLNLYLIGSSKVNPRTGEVLDMLQGGAEEQWILGRDPNDDSKVEDYRVLLSRKTADAEQRYQATVEAAAGVAPSGVIFTKDYGILMRGPHPHHHDRLVMIMAGAHALGTSAACLAATHPPLIREVARRLREDCQYNLADRTQTFWALLRATMSEETEYVLTPKNVAVDSVGLV